MSRVEPSFTLLYRTQDLCLEALRRRQGFAFCMLVNTIQTPARRGFSAVPFLGDMLVLTRLLRDSEAKTGLKLIALMTLLYVVSPIDFIPEAVMPWIAWIDDVGIVLAVRAWLDPELRKYRYPLFGKPEASGWHQPAAMGSAFNPQQASYARAPNGQPIAAQSYGQPIAAQSYAQSYGPREVSRRPAPF